MGEFDKIMAKAFKLADKGLGYTSPNPAVGAVILKNAEIISTGYHRKAGQPHAEIEALNLAGDRARGATLVVTLEPCSHFGKTPPCADAIIKAGISRVVSATCDPNPLVCGFGFRRLRDAGIDVVNGVLENRARKFYRPYAKFIKTGVPFVTLKYAQSLDGRLATRTGNSQWISSQESLKYSHRLRAVNDAIIVGRKTLSSDNPRLTTRLAKGSNPIRIVLSAGGKFPSDRAMFNDGQAPTYIATLSGTDQTGDIKTIAVKKRANGLDIEDLLLKLAKMGIMNVLVEGGAQTLTSFLTQRLADKIIICMAPILIGDGIDAIGDLGIRNLVDSVKLNEVQIKKVGVDFIISGYPVWK